LTALVGTWIVKSRLRRFLGALSMTSIPSHHVINRFAVPITLLALSGPTFVNMYDLKLTIVKPLTCLMSSLSRKFLKCPK
jgi:hypothetical protein